MNMRILYVDDEPDIREIAAMALSLDPDFRVTTAGSGHEALVLLSEISADLVLLDVMMPGMDGPTLLGLMRDNPQLAMIPVIFITARAQPSELQNFATLDATGVIAKPFDPLTLSGQIRQLIHRRV